MPTDLQALDAMQAAYKAAIDTWIAAIQHEEELGMVDHTVVQVDEWEQAGFQEEDLRSKAKAAKKKYEQALRSEFYGFDAR